MKELQPFLESLAELLSDKKIVIASHANADLDAIASALAAGKLVEQIGATGGILVDGISELSRDALRALSIDLKEAPHGEACLVVDASSWAQLGAAREACSSTGLVILIDHHAPGGIAQASSLSFIDESAGSTSEILVEALSLAGATLREEEATLLSMGILADTKMLMRPGSRTFWAMSVLQRWGCDYGLAVRILSEKRKKRQEDLSYRMALLKALSRLRVGRACGDIIVAATHVSSFESDASSAILSLGADVALVAADKEGSHRISIRVSERALARGLKASLLALYLAERLGGEGGGHERVAMAHLALAKDPESVTADIFSSIQGKLGRMCQGEHQAEDIR